MDDVISPNRLNELRCGFPPPLVIDLRSTVYDALYAWCRSLQDEPIAGRR
jgi:hypothetical protein